MLNSYKKQGTKQGVNYHYTYTLNDIYFMLEDKLVSKREYFDFMREFFKELIKEIVVNRFIFRMPFGIIRIKKVNSSKAINWKETKLKGKYVYYLNLHTDRKYFRFAWEQRSKLKKSNTIYYRFTPIRKAKKFLSNYIFDCANDPMVRDYECLN